MTSFVVRDITGYDQKNSSISGKGKTGLTTITPFHKVLEEEEKKGNVRVASSQPVESSSRTEAEKTSVSDDSLAGIFLRASKKYNISYDFLTAVAKAESDFNTKSVSSAGAKGIMQLMPYECEEFGVTDPYDAEQNIMAAAKLLKAHLKKFDGDYELAAAAYNAGSGTVQKYGGVPPYTETQNYVKKIKKYMKEGVKVPGAEGTVEMTGNSEGEGGKTSVSSSVKSQTASFDEGKEAGEDDWEQVAVSLGSGDKKMTMTYGAYLKYLELGTTGVG